MKKIFYLLSLTLLIFVGCGDKKKEEVKEVAPAQEEVKKPAEVTSDQPVSNDIVIEADDNMRFSMKTIRVNGGQKVKITLKHTGKMTKDLMGHNLVILKKDVKLNDFAQKANTAKDTDYIPAEYKESIIAQTKMIGGGEETIIEFDAPEAGTYDFLCTFPAHFALMRGKFIVQ